MQDDLDWADMCSDFRLIQFCRELTALARPVGLDTVPRRSRVRRKARAGAVVRARPA